MPRAPKLFLLALSISLTATAFAQQPDYHLTQDRNRGFYKECAFAHGHRHGYEEGFHAGDEDYQLRRPGYLLQRSAKAKGYVPVFGDKNQFNSGYEAGFRAGYADSFSGKSFRALNPITLESAAASPSDLQSGFVSGYRAGYINSNSIADEPGIAESASWRCQQERHSAAFCNAYGSGYVLGKTDKSSIALLNQAQPTSLAKNAPTH